MGSISEGLNAIPNRVASSLERLAYHRSSKGSARSCDCTRCYVNRDSTRGVVGAVPLTSSGVSVKAKQERHDVLLALISGLLKDRAFRFLDVGLPLINCLFFPVERFVLVNRQLGI